MFLVFSRCAGLLEEGRRLDNLTWRLWNRETFCCNPIKTNSTAPTISILATNSIGYSKADVPNLSSSPGSLAAQKPHEFNTDSNIASTSALVNVTPCQIQRQDSIHNLSCTSKRHTTPDELEKMVITIKEKKELEPLSLVAPLAAKNTPQEPASTPQITSSAVKSKSDYDSNSSAQPASSRGESTPSVVRGFSPLYVSSSYRSLRLLTAPSSIPTTNIAALSEKAYWRANSLPKQPYPQESIYYMELVEFHKRSLCQAL